MYRDYFVTVVDCGQPQMPSNGHVSSFMTTYGSIVNFTCSGGYNVIGLTSRTCEANGHWSGQQPKCQSKSNSCTCTSLLLVDAFHFLILKLWIVVPCLHQKMA